MTRSGRQTYTVGDHSLSVSNLGKVFYPVTGTTKAEVMEYYLAVAQVIIPQVAQRPVTRKRWVDGVGTAEQPGQVFFRKDLEDSAPSWIPVGRITHSERTNTYPLANDPAVLAWFAQVAALELHTPQWRFGRNGQPRNPDRLVLDLDPGEGAGLTECAEVARWCRDILADMGMESFPVTSGSKGIHLYAALDGQHNADAISAVAHELAKALEADHPDEVISSMRKASRAGKVFVDWSQNNGSKTTVSPYSLRGRERPWVAAPRTWEELEDPDLRHLEMSEVLQRVAEGQDPLAPLGWVPDGAEGDDAGRSPSARGHGNGSGTGPAADRLATYRSMRDASKTAEPVPEEAPVERQFGGAERPSFVIQEHHARRLHWDFRLEHSGVLVSWAVPKGPPLDTESNRLAVQTEDHPLEYGTFEGTIAKGEYGAGEVTIWDAGTIEIEKWREGKEVIAVLSGRPDGGLGGVPRRYALINAPGMGGENNWLIHLMQDQPESSTGRRAAKPAAKPATRAAEDAAFTVADLPAPMLATSGQPADLAADEEWAYEMKWDGYRLLAGVSPGQVALASRNGKDLTADYPALQELTGLLTGAAAEYGGAVLDGELVALDAQGRPDFGLLQEASGRTSRGTRRRPGRPGPAAETAPSGIDLRYLVFDILQLGPPGASGRQVRSLLRTHYGERREVLEAAVGNGDVVSVPPGYRGTLARAQQASRELQLEGVVAKRSDSTYRPGQRSSAWIKLKLQQHQEVVVIGARRGQGGRAGGIGSLLLAVPDASGELHYAGRVGTGFTAAQLEEAASKLRSIRRKTPPVRDVPAADQSDAWWVRPRLVGEVNLAGRTRSGRVRQASWRGWRPDKDPDEVRWETP
ncbi:ATP-dependent DNA ligase [Citricoccus nitrophenolicus]|uniref:DNA ligase (ATP) n=1 Tax=Citricoccus nitrophenolicus TaxID=863575 RepID=A0ABV0IIE3_9MICC